MTEVQPLDRLQLKPSDVPACWAHRKEPFSSRKATPKDKPYSDALSKCLIMARRQKRKHPRAAQGLPLLPDRWERARAELGCLRAGIYRDTCQ